MSPAWQVDALCRQVDAGLFFPEVGESPAPALRVCAACEVRSECRADVLAADLAASYEPYGVCGGLTERQRRRLRRDGRRAAAASAAGAAGAAGAVGGAGAAGDAVVVETVVVEVPAAAGDGAA